LAPKQPIFIARFDARNQLQISLPHHLFKTGTFALTLKQQFYEYHLSSIIDTDLMLHTLWKARTTLQSPWSHTPSNTTPLQIFPCDENNGACHASYCSLYSTCFTAQHACSTATLKNCTVVEIFCRKAQSL